MDSQNQQLGSPIPNTPPSSGYGSGFYSQLRSPIQPDFSSPPPTPDAVNPPPRRFPSLKLLIGLFAFLLIALGIIAAAIIFIRQQPKKVNVTTSTKSQLCFVRTAHLDCVDNHGDNRVRYDLPVPQGGVSLTNLVASADQTKFLAFSSYDTTPNDIWILDQKLNIVSKVTIPTGMIASTPSWARDDQTILLALKDAQNSQQIYRLTPSNNTVQQLTTSANPTSTPYETQDEHIIYGVLDSQTNNWQPYVMDKDGSHTHPLGDLTTLSSVSGFSYDIASDTTFVYGPAVAGGQAIVYAPIDNFLNSQAVQTIAATAQPGDTVGPIDTQNLFIRHNSLASIVNTNNNLPITVRQFGTPVGLLQVASFHRSAQQAEQPYERIINLANTPGDFATSIETIFTQSDATCQADPTAQADDREFILVINQVVSDQYAVTSQGCGALAPAYYAVNTSNQWVQVLAGNNIPTCSVINTYNFPKTVFQECYNPSNKLVPNNPQTDTS